MKELRVVEHRYQTVLALIRSPPPARRQTDSDEPLRIH
jgi:hypothetical protein